MKPFRAFLYVFMILSGFLVVSYCLSKKNPLSLPNEEYHSDIDTIKTIAEVTFLDSAETDVLDTLSVENILENISENTVNVGLQYPSGDSAVFNPFFNKLKNLKAFQSSLRILYFGDSQIEGDRITSTIRNLFQQKFGGAGIGLVAPDLLYNISHSFTIDRSADWRIINFSDLNDHLKNRSLVFKDAILLPGTEGWFKIKQIRNNESKSDYLQLKMFYRSASEFGVVVKEGARVIYDGKVSGTPIIEALNFKFNFTPASIEVFFQPADSLEISGFSLETPSGVQVDNIAMRGLSFPPFSKSEKTALEETIRLINPGLCVLHFGVNIAPNYRESYKYYRIRLVREIKKIQQLMHDVPVLIVGISDMAKKENGEMVSYPNIHAIKKAQFEAARICNCVFWDLEEFMGGAGSMIEWVNANPRLGQKDYIHFTPQGTEKVGTRLSELILDEYRNYLKISVVE